MPLLLFDRGHTPNQVLKKRDLCVCLCVCVAQPVLILISSGAVIAVVTDMFTFNLCWGDWRRNEMEGGRMEAE